MKGKSTFTRAQIDILRKLIADKVAAAPDKQKAIRAKIRSIGFYYSDFSSKKEGYTVNDFDSLIRAGLIKVVEHSSLGNKPAKLRVVKDQKPSGVVGDRSKGVTDFAVVLESMQANRFDPMTDNENTIDHRAGNYIVCLKKGSSLPFVSVMPVFTSFKDLKVIYTGIAGSSLRTRDYRQHFKGNNAGRSTLRKSLGVLFGYKLVPRDRDPTTGKTKFADLDEANLSDWMGKNLLLFFYPTSNYALYETSLIQHFNPPLNLQGNSNLINYEYRKLLSKLRGSK